MSCKIKLSVEDNSNNVILASSEPDEVNLLVEDYVQSTINLYSSDYEDLTNKPAIDTVELYKGTKLADIGIEVATNSEINNLFK